MFGGKAATRARSATTNTARSTRKNCEEKSVAVSVGQGQGTTGICVVLVTPDAERTLCTFLGICRELGPQDVDLDAIKSSKYLYVTGYLWDTDTQKEAVLLAMRTAKEAGVKVALSLSDPFCVNRHKADFLNIAKEYVDLLIGNDEEAQSLTDTDNPHDAIRATTGLCDMAVVTMGSRGALLRKGEEIVEVPAYKVHAIDTTGAGDMYAAGILYGLTQGLSLEKTGQTGGLSRRAGRRPSRPPPGYRGCGSDCGNLRLSDVQEAMRCGSGQV